MAPAGKNAPWGAARLGAAIAACALVTVVHAGDGNAGSVASSGRAAAAKAYNVGGAMDLSGSLGYRFLSTTGPVVIDFDRLENDANVSSGPVVVDLFLSTQPLTGPIVPITIARITYAPFGPLARIGPVVETVPYIPPPDGIYYVHLGVFEQEASSCRNPTGYCADDYTSFANRVQVTNGTIVEIGPDYPTARAVEYFHAGFGHYFVTSFPTEIAALDSGQFAGWVRTGETFDVWSSGADLEQVCRFFSAAFAPKSSHFYTPDDSECRKVKLNPDWTYEAIAFRTYPPDPDGSCPPFAMPLYRLYNDGKSGAPNHRYTKSPAVRSTMAARGWIAEGYGTMGVIACVPN